MKVLGVLMRRRWFQAAAVAVGALSLTGGIVFAQGVDNRNPFFVVVGGVQKAGIDADGDGQFDGTLTAGTGNEVLTNADGTLRLGALEAGGAADDDLMFYDTGAGSWGPGAIQALRLPDGSAGAPGYGWANDTDSGGYLVSDGVVGWSTAAALRMRLSSSGLELGVDDNLRVPAILYGDNDTSGGLLRVGNAANEDSSVGAWDIEADEFLTFKPDGGAYTMRVTSNGWWIQSTTPQTWVVESDAATDEKNWLWNTEAGVLTLQLRTDGFGAGANVLTIDRATTASALVTVPSFASSSAALTGGSINSMNIGASTRGTGAFTTLASNSTTTLAGATTVSGTLSATNSVTLSPANQAVTLSPTGSGTVTVNPATAGTMNNVAIGGTTPAAGTFAKVTTAAGSGLTIASGVITATHSYHVITPQTGLGTADDLDTINGGAVIGQRLILLVAGTFSTTVVIKHATGNIDRFGGDMTLFGGGGPAEFVWTGTVWSWIR